MKTTIIKSFFDKNQPTIIIDPKYVHIRDVVVHHIFCGVFLQV